MFINFYLCFKCPLRVLYDRSNKNRIIVLSEIIMIKSNNQSIYILFLLYLQLFLRVRDWLYCFKGVAVIWKNNHRNVYRSLLLCQECHYFWSLSQKIKNYVFVLIKSMLFTSTLKLEGFLLINYLFLQYIFFFNNLHLSFFLANYITD